MKLKYFITISSIILFLSACVTVTQTPVNNNLSSSYNPAAQSLHPLFRAYFEETGKTKIYFKIFTKELLFSKANKEGKEKAVLKINYQVRPSFRSDEILDSATSSLPIQKIKKQTSLVTFMTLNEIKAEKYIVEINVYDKYSRRKSKSYVEIDKSVKDNFNNYMSFFETNNKPLFLSRFKSNQQLIIKHNSKKTDTLFVKY